MSRASGGPGLAVRPRWSALLLVAMLALAARTAAAAEARTGIAVVSRITDPVLRLQYTPQERSLLEAGLTRDAALALQDQIGVFDFLRAGAGDTLVLEIGEQNRQGLSPINFVLALRGATVLPVDLPVVWEFLSEDEAQVPLGEPESFRAGAAAVFRARVREGSGELVTKLLSHVVLTRKVSRVQGARYWVLPFRKDELRIDLKSRFELRQSLSTPALNLLFDCTSEVRGSTPAENLVVLFISDPAHEELENPELRTDGVYLLEYRPAAVTPAPRPLP